MAALIKHFIILSLLYCGMAIQCVVHAQSSIVVDQSNMSTDTDSNGASAPFSFGQSFTPELTGINTFEFLLGGANAISKIRIRDGLLGTDGLGAAVLAESTPTAIAVAGSNLYRFDFGAVVPLVAGRTYVAELLVLTGDLGVRLTSGDTYAGGQYLVSGFTSEAFTSYDMVFREGVTPVPEPSAAALFCIGLAYLVVRSLRRLRRFETDIGSIQNPTATSYSPTLSAA